MNGNQITILENMFRSISLIWELFIIFFHRFQKGISTSLYKY